MAPYASLTAGNVAERYKAFHAATEVECFHMRGTVSYEKEDFTCVFDVILLWWTFATLVHLYYMTKWRSSATWRCSGSGPRCCGA
eukprot:466122-Rhodomonas_salina.1